MSELDFKLGVLLNDDTFIYWIKNDERLTDSMKEKWDKWLSSSEDHQELLKKAKKIIELPFIKSDKDYTSHELLRLKNSIKNEDSKDTE